MEPVSGSSKGTHSSFNYDDVENDSDLESRLYAEIHYTNTIIGEENNSDAPISNNKSSNSAIIVTDKIEDNDLTTYRKKIGQQTNIVNEKLSTDLAAVSKINHDADSSTRNKRLSEHNNSNTSRKRKKQQSDNCINEQKTDKNSSDISADKPSTSIEKQQKELINPYNKQNNGTEMGMKLLSQEFYDIFFRNKSRAKRKLAKSLSKNVNQQKNSKNDVNLLKSQDKEPVCIQSNEHGKSIRSETQKNDDTSTVIEISSDDSENSNDDSKYNKTVATEKKLEKTESAIKSLNAESDSESSIFEVPVPPKPAPPVIELEVSDDDNHIETDDDSDSSSNGFLDICEENSNDVIEKSLNNGINSVNAKSNLDSGSVESDSLMLNCTNVQIGASSINEIMNMSRPDTHEKNISEDTNKSVQNIVEKAKTTNTSNCSTKSSRKKVDGLVPSKDKQRKKSCSTAQDIPIEQYFFLPMSDEMKAFYNDSWGGENFDMDELKNKMSRDPKKWAILDTDFQLLGPKRRRYFGMVCARCHNNGHRSDQCPEKFKIPTCHMCGASGHFETACPRKQCLTCGRKTNMYRKTCDSCQNIYCRRCNSRGHSETTCPDLWRRYHNTMHSPSVKQPSNIRNTMKSQRDMFCCNCAKQGHDSTVCKKLKWSQHFINPAHVTDYRGPDYVLEKHHTSRSMNDSNESSYNSRRTLHDSSSQRSRDDTINLDSSYDDSPKPTETDNSNSMPIKQNLPQNNQRTSNIVLNIKSPNVIETEKFNSFKLKFTLDKKNSYDNEHWETLSVFLKELALLVPVSLVVEQNRELVFVSGCCPWRYAEIFRILIKQYVCRSSLYRSHMYYKLDRQDFVIINDINEKITSMNRIKEDPLQIFEEIKQMDQQLLNQDSYTKNDLRSSLKLNRLMIHREKLIMLMYREGFADESLKKLTKLKTKITKPNGKKVPKYTSISVKHLLNYLYLYNNIFVPYEPSYLSESIKKYEEHIQRSDRLRNNPVLFPMIREKDHNRSKEITIQDDSCNSTVTNVKDLSSKSAEQVTPVISRNAQPSTSTWSFSNDFPLLQQGENNFTFNFNINNSIPQNSLVSSRPINIEESQVQAPVKNVIDNIAELRKNDNKKYNELYLSSIRSKDEESRQEYRARFHHSVENTLKLLKVARQLNSPRLQKHIDILQDKMKNVIEVQQKDVKQFRKRVNQEKRRQQRKLKS